MVTTNRDDANTHPSLPRPLPGFNCVQVTTMPVAPTETDVSTTITTFMDNIIIHFPVKETVAKGSHIAADDTKSSWSWIIQNSQIIYIIFFQNLVRYASFPIHQPKPPAFQKMNLDLDKFRFTKWLNPSPHNLKCFHLSFATCLYTGLCLAQLTDASDNSYWNLQWFCDYLHGSW